MDDQFDHFGAPAEETQALLREYLGDDHFQLFQRVMEADSASEAAAILRARADEAEQVAEQTGVESHADELRAIAAAVDSTGDGSPLGSRQQPTVALMGSGGHLRGRCTQHTRRGTGYGICARPLDMLGRCARPGDHVQSTGGTR